MLLTDPNTLLMAYERILSYIGGSRQRRRDKRCNCRGLRSSEGRRRGPTDRHSGGHLVGQPPTGTFHSCECLCKAGYQDAQPCLAIVAILKRVLR